MPNKLLKSFAIAYSETAKLRHIFGRYYNRSL